MTDRESRLQQAYQQLSRSVMTATRIKLYHSKGIDPRIWDIHLNVDYSTFLEHVSKIASIIEHRKVVNLDELIEHTGLDLGTLSRYLDLLVETGIVPLPTPVLEVKRSVNHIPISKPERIHSPNANYDQLFCTWDTSIRKARKIYEDAPTAESVLLIGDDDLISINLASYMSCDVHVADIDKAVLSEIRMLADENGLDNIYTHHVDVRKSIPRILENRFDIFVCDPPYTLGGIKVFIFYGYRCLKKKEGARGYVSYPISFGNSWIGNNALAVQAYAHELGFLIEEVVPRFNLYELFDGMTWEKIVVQKYRNFRKHLGSCITKPKIAFTSDLVVFRLIDSKIKARTVPDIEDFNLPWSNATYSR